MYFGLLIIFFWGMGSIRAYLYKIPLYYIGTVIPIPDKNDNCVDFVFGSSALLVLSSSPHPRRLVPSSIRNRNTILSKFHLANKKAPHGGLSLRVDNTANFSEMTSA